MSDFEVLEEIWFVCYDDVEENVDIVCEIWEESEFKVIEEFVYKMLFYLESKDVQFCCVVVRLFVEVVS